jgi:DNA-binding NarL/FixJ family response regulator
MTLHCLIVDDSTRFLDAARGHLAREGIIVVGVASTISQALQQAERLRPDVTLVDIDLADESGFELARRLQQAARSWPSRVILVSSHAEDDFADLIAASPAVGFLSKADLSAGAIRDLLGLEGDGAAARANEPSGT